MMNTFLNKIEKVNYEVRKVLVGQEDMLEALLLATLCRGHILLEGAPGLAKTLTVNTLAKALGLPFKRIQFTPDLLPSDIIGTEIYNQAQNAFTVNQGPIFANFVLADEINRAPAKVQSALLEAMQEKQVTIGNETFKLDRPFLVLATQNPIEQEGTYQLPEAQLDRFLMKIIIDYPTPSDELTILQRVVVENKAVVEPVMTKDELIQMINFVQGIYLDPEVMKYIVNVNVMTRSLNEYTPLSNLARFVDYGASPRGAISMAMVSKAKAFLNGRDYVTPDDVVSVIYNTLRHRIILSYVAVAEGITVEAIIDKIVDQVKKPNIDVSKRIKVGQQ